MPKKIEVTPEFESIVIRIGGMMHLWIDSRKLLGVRSWIESGTRQFFIEFVMAGGAVTTYYDKREKWEEILSQLHPILITGKAIDSPCALP